MAAMKRSDILKSDCLLNRKDKAGMLKKKNVKGEKNAFNLDLELLRIGPSGSFIT